MWGFFAAVLITGLSGIVAQLTLLRELLITYQSNELSIGVTLANWLILEAAGSFLFGRVIENSRQRLAVFVSLIAAFSFVLPICVFLARTWRIPFGIALGEGVGLAQIFTSSFLILLPVSFTHGALFSCASKIYAAGLQRAAAGIGRVYALETLGTLAGGLLFSSLLITRLTAFQVALGVSLANFIVCIILLGKKKVSVPFVFLGILAAYAAFGPPATRLQESSIRRQWGAQEVSHYENSRYGNVTVIKREEQYTFFKDGVPAITAPTPDVVFAEEFAHIPLLFHPAPREILILGGGAGGIIRELLRHPVRRIDYAELDPLILRLVERFATPLTRAELGDPRVEVHYRDGRLFLREARRRYDLVFVGVPDPQDLQSNRLFTREFFSLVGERLSPGGILTLSLPGSTTYLSPGLRDLNACIINTLREVFPAARVIPGDGYNILLTSPSPGLTAVGADAIAERLRQADLDLGFLTPAHLAEKLHPRWSGWFEDSLAGATRHINEDFRPLAVYFSLSQWNAIFSPRLNRVFAHLENLGFPLLAAIIGFAAVFLLGLGCTRFGRMNLAMPVALSITGFAGMIFELALIFAFQVLYGVVFFWIGLLVTAFMAGIAIGSLAVTARLDSIRNEKALFLKMEGLLIVFSGLLPLVFLFLRPYLEHSQSLATTSALFLALSLAAGFLIGLEFPLAGKIHLGASSSAGATAGALYAVDLVGGWVGGIVGGVILLPILGLTQTCFIVALLKVVSLLVVATSRPPPEE